MIAFHFPPVAMGSGHLRTLGFVRYLPDQGWEPTVLSANPAAFPRVDTANIGLIPDHCRVHRAFALDARRHLSFRGKYPGFLAQPDRWATWWPAAVWQGLRLIRRHRISAIWSTYPIMTAHSIASTLSRMTGLPWIADFRDPVVSSVESGNQFSVSSQNRWEQRVLSRARRVVFTTPGAMRRYAEQYPEVSREGRMAVVPNGYDEAAFSGLPEAADRQSRPPLRLVHSGILYPDGRDPRPFFTALANLRSAGRLTEDDVRIVLRASGSEGMYADEIRRRHLDGMVTLAPPIANSEALIEQADADGLLLFQGNKFNDQIPAKVYEYLRIGRPIFALVGEQGDTAAILRETGGAECVPLDDAATIETRLMAFIEALRAGHAPRVRQHAIARYSRRENATLLAKMFDQVSTESAG